MPRPSPLNQQLAAQRRARAPASRARCFIPATLLMLFSPVFRRPGNGREAVGEKLQLPQWFAMAERGWHRTCDSGRCVAVDARSGVAAQTIEGEQQCAFARA
jgi:hypothetical protein